MRWSVLAVVMACGGATELPGGSSAQTGPPPPPDNGVQVTVVGDVLAPGEEAEMCRWIKAGNDSGAHVTRIEMSAPMGLHHSIVSKAPEAHTNEEVPCFGFPEEAMSGLDVPVPIFASSTQVNEEDLVMPDGVGIAIDANQQLIVNYHFLNTGNTDVVPEVTFNLHFSDGPIQQEASFYGFGNIGDIDIPPQGSQSITMTCPFPAGSQLITATPHMHQKGTDFSAYRHDGTQTTDMLLDHEGWFAPQTTRFDPLVELSSGEGLTFTCAWDNPTDQAVRFGETTDHEMCFVFGFYTPATTDLFGIEGFGCTVDENVVVP